MLQRNSTLYFRWLWATTIFTFFLITVGVTVRAAGAGLGCPDWPKCYGQWVPPIDVSQLPAGFDPADFNAALTWTEYINRLVGITVGFFMLGLLVLAIVRQRDRPFVLWGSIAVFVLTGFQGWLGGRVVSAELAPIMVTYHLVLALVIAGILVALLFAMGGRPWPAHVPAPRALSWLTWGCGALLMVQIVVGTRLRGWIDTSKKIAPNVERHLWLPDAFWPDHLHRQLALLSLLLCGLLLWTAWRHAQAHHPGLARASAFFWVGHAVQIALGVGLAYAGLPPLLQVLHVTVASLLWAVWLWMVFTLAWPGQLATPGTPALATAAQ